MIRVGNMRHRVVLQSKLAGVGARGEQVQQWQEVFRSWAEFEPMTVGQKIAAAAEHPTATHILRIRYRKVLSSIRDLSNYRLVMGSRIFSVLGGVNLEERNMYFEFTVEEGLNNG